MATAPDSSHDKPSLVDRVAQRAVAEPDYVRSIMSAHTVPSAAVPSAPRSLAVERLRVVGTRETATDSGPFDSTLRFPGGVVMIAGANFTGKTSVLEILTLCLRGTARNLQVDVARWLERVECDIAVNGTRHLVTLQFSAGQLTQALLSRVVEPAVNGQEAETQTVIEAGTADEWADKLTAFMLDRLDLTPLRVRTKTGDIQVHSWPSYYGAVYPAAGGERVLIGDTVQAGLAGRLLSIFLDLPNSATLSRVKAARDQAQADYDEHHATEQARIRETSTTRAHYAQAVADARAALNELDTVSAPALATELAQTTSRLSGEVADLEQERRRATGALSTARSERQLDQRRFNDHTESEVARVLFHGLDPSNCPRCEAPVTEVRRRAETTTQVCAVCVTPVAEDTGSTSREEVTTELTEALEASARVEQTAVAELNVVSAEYDLVLGRLSRAEDELRAARQSETALERSRLDRELARAEGALEAVAESVPEHVGDVARLAADLTVLKALYVELEDELAEASRAVFEPLQNEVVELAHRFGISAVSQVQINRAAHLYVTKGGATSPFGRQSPGERLRLRIALLVALLRIGLRLQLATHPGLILIDSLRAEEVDDDDARALLTELIAVAAETPGLQLISTSADTALATALLPEGSVIMPRQGGLSVW